MMSVASKTKTKMVTTVVLGLVAALSILPTWASTTPGISSLPTVTPVVSTSSNQDLWELRTRLKDRFSWIATEVRSLIDGTTRPGESFHGTAPRTIDVRQWIWVEATPARQISFSDIASDPYTTYITRLANYVVLSPSTKFFPQNYFRVDDFLCLLRKLYKKTMGQELSDQTILWISSPDGIMTKWMLQQVMYALNNVERVTIDGNPYDKLIRSEWAYYLVRIFNVPALPIVQQPLAPLEDVFTDIDKEPCAQSITTLANLGIVDTRVPKFYPENYVRHYDFVILLINAFLSSKNASLPFNSSSVQFADVDRGASYIPQLSYAFEYGVIDRIIKSKSWQLYFQPDKFITKHDVYHICPILSSVEFLHNDDEAEQQKISRAELAEVLVACFELKPKEIAPSSSLSWSTLNADDISILMKLKTLISML
jgi:hypothetical protein